MSLEDIVYQSLFFFSFFLFGILGLSFFVHLFRKQPVKKMEQVNDQPKINEEIILNKELFLADKKRREIIAEAQRKRALKIQREKETARYRESRYSVVKPARRSGIAVSKPIMSSTVIENRSLEFYQ